MREKNMKTIGLALFMTIGIATAAFAANLVKEVIQPNGDNMCYYDNGTILNVGNNHCPFTLPYN